MTDNNDMGFEVSLENIDKKDDRPRKWHESFGAIWIGIGFFLFFLGTGVAVDACRNGIDGPLINIEIHK